MLAVFLPLEYPEVMAEFGDSFLMLLVPEEFDVLAGASRIPKEGGRQAGEDARPTEIISHTLSRE
jgi:hypothetical protein